MVLPLKPFQRSSHACKSGNMVRSHPGQSSCSQGTGTSAFLNQNRQETSFSRAAVRKIHVKTDMVLWCHRKEGGVPACSKGLELKLKDHFQPEPVCDFMILVKNSGELGPQSNGTTTHCSSYPLLLCSQPFCSAFS